MKNENLEGLRIFNVSAKILFYLWVFKTEVHDELVRKTDSWTAEEAMKDICDALIADSDDCEKLIAFFEKEADGEECILGIKSQTELTKKQFAAQLLCDLKGLNRPLPIKVDSPPEDF